MWYYVYNQKRSFFYNQMSDKKYYNLYKDVKNKIQENLDLWNINIIASSMGEIMFTDKNYINNCINIILDERNYLYNSLCDFNQLKVYESNGNFILCKLKDKTMTANELREKLIPKKIIIRDCQSFDGLDENFFRICVLKPEDNKYLIDSLKEILS